MSVAVQYIFTWHSLSDACPKCQALNGQDFHNPDIYKSTVWHPIWGDVWHLDEGHSLAHPNCRCQLELRSVEIDEALLFSELKQLMLEFKQQLLVMKGK